MPHPSSPIAPLRPTPLLAVVAAAIVQAHAPAWLAQPVSCLAEAEGIRADRVSRLWRKLLAGMEALLARATRRGRRKKRRSSPGELHQRRHEALLEVAREVIRGGGVNRRRVQDLLVAARDRLKAALGISHQEFAEALGLPPRTVRYWAQRGVAVPREEKPPEPEPPAGDRNEGRFDLGITLPGLQVQGDTTNLEVLGVPLKVVALQDPGRRHEVPWEGFAAETEENHEVIVGLLEEILADRPGTQFVVDQGTPYMAGATQEACDELELFHEPQKEGTPTDKSPLERSFGVVKSCLAPLLALTNKAAAVLPALARPELARPLARLLLGTYLRVYLMAARPRETNRSEDRTVLESIACAQREKAVAERRSTRLLLAQVFDRCGFEGSSTKFVNTWKGYRAEDVEEAERRLQRQIVRGTTIQHPVRYFTAILLNVTRERRPGRERQRELERRAADRKAAEERNRLQIEAHEKALAQHPERRVAEALRILAAQRLPGSPALALGGIGPGTRELRIALQTIARESPGTLRDRAEVGWRIFEKDDPDPEVTPPVRALFDDHVEAAARDAPCPETRADDILCPGSHHPNHERPTPDPDLRNSPARSGET